VKWLLLKKWVGPALGVAVIVIFSGLWFHGYSTGKSSERQVQELRTAEILLRAAQEAERIREHDLKLVMEARDRETTIVERIRNVPINIPTPECTTLGDEWLQQYNDVIEAINTRESVD
jgi:hypothetical protein